MKRYILFLTGMLCSFLSQAQQDSGVAFNRLLTWKEIQRKAKAENKYIFIDAFATWCAPCKLMSDSVFTRKALGEFINEKFISVQVQMDTSKKDDSYVKSWYADAGSLFQLGKITVIPTFLFFSPEGQLVHKDAGFKGARDLRKLAEMALDPGQQYYTLVNQFRESQIPYGQLPDLINKAKELEEHPLADSMSRYYIEYLNKLPDHELLSKKNVDFLSLITPAITSKDKLFLLSYSRPTLIDSAFLNPGFAQGIVDYVIAKEEIKTEQSPDFGKLENRLARKYNPAIAERNILRAKMSSYAAKKDFDNYANALVKYVDKYQLNVLPKNNWSSVFLNDYAWKAFLYCNNKTILRRALVWIDIAISYVPEFNPAIMDTKANLLYKLGRKTEAIVIQEKVVANLYAQADKEGYDRELFVTTFKKTLDKMKQNQPTWNE